MPRKLRIAVSVFFGVLTVAMCGLWLRSYSRTEYFECPATATQQFRIDSIDGWLTLAVYDDLFKGLDPRLVRRWRFHTDSDAIRRVIEERMRASGRFRLYQFGLVSDMPGVAFRFPWTLPVLLSCVVAGVIGVSVFCQLSLRALLIATTLFAVVLGLGGWLAS